MYKSAHLHLGDGFQLSRKTFLEDSFLCCCFSELGGSYLPLSLQTSKMLLSVQKHGWRTPDLMRWDKHDHHFFKNRERFTPVRGRRVGSLRKGGST